MLPPSAATVAVLLHLAAALLAAGHALLHKRDPRAAWGWIALCLLAPAVGVLLYWLLGINRIESHARRHTRPRDVGATAPVLPETIPGCSQQEVRELVRIGAAVTGRPLVPGNAVEPLYEGAAAYEAMLGAIAQARRSIHLATYIYQCDEIGTRFAEALAAARARGVQVRVLVDGVSDAWNRPRASRLLERHGVPVARFLPLRLWPPLLHLNLRNHRKLLLVDEAVGFTGGMNIADGHWQAHPADRAMSDLHFRVTGPLVAQLEDVFRADWQLAAGERLPAPASPPADGPVMARAIADGPHDDADPLAMILLGAIAAAHERIWIMTPYFIPTAAIVAALQSAALRGVEVCLLLPVRSDQPWIDWATRHWLWQVLARGVRVFTQPGPFAHGKLILVDGYYCQFGSANLDVRSLRLNFELVVEAFDPELNGRLAEHYAATRARAREVTLREIDARPLAVRLRDAACWLFSPYL